MNYENILLFGIPAVLLLVLFYFVFFKSDTSTKEAPGSMSTRCEYNEFKDPERPGKGFSCNTSPVIKTQGDNHCRQLCGQWSSKSTCGKCPGYSFNSKTKNCIIQDENATLCNKDTITVSPLSGDQGWKYYISCDGEGETFCNDDSKPFPTPWPPKRDEPDCKEKDAWLQWCKDYYMWKVPSNRWPDADKISWCKEHQDRCPFG